MRLIATILVIVMAGLPSLFAGWPGLAPDWFDNQTGGVPNSVLAMSALMLAFVVLAAISSAIAKGRGLPGGDAR